MVASSSSLVGLHEYEYGEAPPEAVGEPPIIVLPPAQIALSLPALAVGGEFTVSVAALEVVTRPHASLTQTS